MSGDDEFREMQTEIESLKLKHAAALEVNVHLARRLGQMEQQRNHERWKYARAKKRWREIRDQLAQSAIPFPEGNLHDRVQQRLPNGASVTSMEHVPGVGLVVTYK